jgi:hypothetical protein
VILEVFSEKEKGKQKPDSDRVKQPVTEHFSASGRPDARGGFPCFWCPNKT